jgi:2-keto-4-pentenoate hydratase/2-oxohepta-3-ene-1,7-dioic acid hydratase in catechol pathway
VKLVRFRDDVRIRTGVLEGDAIRVISGTFFENPVPTGGEVGADDVRLLAPVIPSKVVAVGRNYVEHAEELGNVVPEEPLIFMKPSTSVIGPGDPIPIPPESKRVDHEGELAVVVGRLCRRVTPEEASKYVLGYACGNDVTARDLQEKDDQWTRSKGFDGFCPLGPCVETELDPSDVEVACRVNGEVRQSGRTSAMAFPPAMVVSYVSQAMTLLPGDVILTGTPAGVGRLVPGDEVEVEVEGIGVLANPVVSGG